MYGAKNSHRYKDHRKVSERDFLNRFNQKDEFLFHTVTGDVTCISYINGKMKQQFMQWRDPVPLNRKKLTKSISEENHGNYILGTKGWVFVLPNFYELYIKQSTIVAFDTSLNDLGTISLICYFVNNTFSLGITIFFMWISSSEIMRRVFITYFCFVYYF